MNADRLLERITINPGIFGGKPIIRGRRLAVEHVLGCSSRGIAQRPYSRVIHGSNRKISQHVSLTPKRLLPMRGSSRSMKKQGYEDPSCQAIPLFFLRSYASPMANWYRALAGPWSRRRSTWPGQHVLSRLVGSPIHPPSGAVQACPGV